MLKLIRHRSAAILVAAALLWSAGPVDLFSATSGASKKIVLLAGPLDTHPRETHEYEKNVILLKHCLETSPDLTGVRVEAHFNGWPADPATLDDADAIFLTSGGSDRQETDHPLYVGDRFAQLEKQMRRGCGVVFFHWSTFHPRRVHDRITEWAGGYFDYEGGTNANHWYSAIQTREWSTALGSPAHPIARGVQPFKLTEEFYFHLRFRDDDPRITPILLHTAAGDVEANTVGWAVQRKEGGRAFGFTGGHFFKNWWLADFRKLILNAIAWTAHIEVPRGGIRSSLEERRRVLIVTGANHPAHDWRATTAALLFALEQDPRLLVEVTEDPGQLASPHLHEHALVVLNYCNWERPGLSAMAQTNLTRYLSNGGGLSVIHFANGAFHFSLPGAAQSDWPEYRHIVRRVWDHQGASGHDAYGLFHVELGESHDITRGLSGFDTMDELYFKQSGTNSIIPLATARSKVTGQAEPMAWAHGYGAGRIFQTVLGHSAESVQRAAPLMRRGSAWAAGLPPLSFDPPTRLLEHAAFRAGAPWKPSPR
ncbi:MAG: hypothetical protein QOF48_2419 [Verrucomicrobiota bacterium]|jgi:type 1 glutamine amidotransferase